MMVETVLDTSQEFGMSNGALPQWKRELLQRRAARPRPAPAPAAAPPPPPPPPPPAVEDDEELRYGPGIVKRLKSRYLSLAMREAPRRRPSVLRRAASLEHLIDERPAPAPRPARSPRPASVAAAPPPHPRRDSVKRARSVDALSRLEEAPPPPAPRLPPEAARAPRPPRRPAPLLRDAERPPPDLVRTTLRKFQRGAPTPRPAPAARVPAVVRGLEAPLRAGIPEREPSPPPPALPATPPPPPALPATPPPPALAASTPKIERSPSPTMEPPPSSPSPAPTTAALSPAPSPLPVVRPVSPVAPSPPRPAPAPAPPDATGDDLLDPIPKEDEFGSTLCSDEVDSGGGVGAGSRRVSRAALEGIARAGSSVRYAFEAARGGAGSHLPPLGTANPVLVARRVGVIRPMPAPARASPPPPERPAWARAAARPRAPPAHATSVVFNFSARKEVPDYIENDGIVLRGSRRPKIKAGETGAVWVRGAGGGGGADDSDEGDGGEDETPLRVRFVNDNVLINGRSSMPARPDRQRQAKLKLQFDDSLTRTHEYPSETSLTTADDSPPAPAPVAPALADNTHIASAALSRYAPSKTRAAAAPLGLAPQHAAAAAAPAPAREETPDDDRWEAASAPAPAPWSAARALATDMLF